MPIMKVCPNRSKHPPIDVKVIVHNQGEENEFKRYVPIYPKYKTPMGKRPVMYNPQDRMIRLYSRQLIDGKTLFKRTEYWYCPKCNLVVHDSYIDRYKTESKYLMRDKTS